MIDVEVDVFNYVYTYVSSLVPTGNFTSQFNPSPSSLPFATLIEMDNSTDVQMRSSSDTEDYAILMYEANVYAEDKTTCRSVMNALDNAMIQLGFTRISMQFVPNLADTTLFRLTARYRAAADGNKVIYRHQ